MINRYKKYLEIIDVKLAHMFESQAPFLKCKKGCAYCCKEGEYPLSELEFVNLMLYYHTLSYDKKGIINQNIENLLEKKREKFYECPFLSEGECLVYPARPILCRTFGLMYFQKDDTKKVPFCVDLGLNYSDVYDKDTGSINCPPDSKTIPEAYNIDRRVLRNKEMEDLFDIYFGEDRPLVDWLKEDCYFGDGTADK